MQVVGEAKDGIEAKQMVADLGPDILLLDLVMPGPRPYEIEKWVRTNYPETITLVLTGHDRDYYLKKMMDAGAVGFLTKDEEPQRLVEAIRLAARGDAPLYSAEQYRRVRRWQEKVEQHWESLTEREREVLELIVKGKSNKEIAQELKIKMKTVGNHVSSILGKLNVASRTEAALWAVKEGFIDQTDT